MKQMVICGGGAAGLVAAITYKQTYNRDVCIIEKNMVLGRKILSTGNGRGNFSNQSIHGYDYRQKGSIQERFLFNDRDAISFYERLGVFPVAENGRIYPRSFEASSLQKALVYEVKRLQIPVFYERDIIDIKPLQKGYRILTSQGDLEANQVVMAMGTAAGIRIGGSSQGFQILKNLGVCLTPISPGLTAFETADRDFQSIHGVRLPVSASLIEANKPIFIDRGEMLFTKYGLSGIVIMNMTVFYESNMDVRIDLLPDFSAESLYGILGKRKEKFPSVPVADFFLGLLPEKLSALLIKRAGIKSMGHLSPVKIQELVKDIKLYMPTITGLKGWDQAQIAVGGVDIEALSPHLELKTHPNLYVVGELLDMAGRCGGYNLHFALMTGQMAGLGGGLRK